ncbi:MAG: hypothetical protein U1D30_11040 [Planctomycetota bacterium]
MIPSNLDAGQTEPAARQETVRVPQVLFVALLVVAGLYLGIYRGTYTRRKTPSQNYSKVNRLCRTYLKVLAAEGITGVENRQLMVSLSPFARANLQSAADHLAKSDPASLMFVQLERRTQPGGSSVDSEEPAEATYEVKTGEIWQRVELEVDNWRKPTRILALNVEPVPEGVQSKNAFRIEGKPLGNYVILGIAVIVPLFTLYVVILCLFEPVDTRPWAQYAWLVFILFGIGHFSINWTTGTMSARPASIRFPVARVFRPDVFSNWYLTVSCPVGALLYLRKRQTQRLQRAKELAAQSLASTSAKELVPPPDPTRSNPGT